MPTADSSNSYCTRAEADTEMGMRLHTASWTGATTANREIALIWATRLLDEQMGWLGAPTVPGQTLAWPRSGMLGPTGAAIGTGDIPTLLKRATAELAMRLLESDRPADSGTAGLESLTAGPLTLQFAASQGGPPRVVIPQAVAETLSIWGSPRFGGGGRGGPVALARV